MSENKDKKPFTEKLEDALDEVVYKAQNAVYGERRNLYEDIPATMEDPNGFRKINKYATRRNLVRKLVKHPKILLALAGELVAIVVIIVLLT